MRGQHYMSQDDSKGPARVNKFQTDRMLKHHKKSTDEVSPTEELVKNSHLLKKIETKTSEERDILTRDFQQNLDQVIQKNLNSGGYVLEHDSNNKAVMGAHSEQKGAETAPHSSFENNTNSNNCYIIMINKNYSGNGGTAEQKPATSSGYQPRSSVEPPNMVEELDESDESDDGLGLPGSAVIPDTNSESRTESQNSLPKRRIKKLRQPEERSPFAKKNNNVKIVLVDESKPVKKRSSLVSQTSDGLPNKEKHNMYLIG